MRRRIARIAGAAVIAVVAACSAQSGGGGPTLDLANGTTIPVLLYVNGTWLGTYPAGAAPGDIAVNAPLPWHVEARNGAGRALVSMDTDAAEASRVTVEDTGNVHTGKFGWADLLCGRIDLWIGSREPLGPAPGSGSPGDCG